MLYAQRFAADEAYRDAVWQPLSVDTDRPLVVQFCANDADDFVRAAALAQPHCDAVDLNLGCPLRRAHEERFGSALMDRKHWTAVQQIGAPASFSLL